MPQFIEDTRMAFAFLVSLCFIGRLTKPFLFTFPIDPLISGGMVCAFSLKLRQDVRKQDGDQASVSENDFVCQR